MTWRKIHSTILLDTVTVDWVIASYRKPGVREGGIALARACRGTPPYNTYGVIDGRARTTV